MGRFHSVSALLVSALLLLSFSHGFGRKLMQTVENDTVPLEENGGLSREMIELDYVEAGPNTNPKSGFIQSNLPPPPPPSPES
ncbi:Centrosomal protein [Actinidia chinensis var. chinensis]|uniref:Centrosomal protein n=1 Tax=Actinidia chinensis var. chinensis TaxID=1590841 RepID=A0A2R6RUM6_ACTCC|nr:Centrosomal protein [Actinidia chinensis var. chinensis]